MGHFKQFLLLLLITFLYSEKCFAQRIQKLDDQIMINIQEHRTPEQTGVFLFLSKNYLYVNIGIPTVMMAGGLMDNNKALRENAVYVGSSTLISYGATYLIKNIFKRRRPFVQNTNIVPVYRPQDYSFPSGHSSSTFATATALSIAYPKWYIIAPAYLWSGSVAYSRMYLGVHYPTDVAAGILLGTGTAASMSFMKK